MTSTLQTVVNDLSTNVAALFTGVTVRVEHGAPEIDCAGLYVWVEQVYTASPVGQLKAAPTGKTPTVPSATVGYAVVSCVTSMTDDGIPPAATISAESNDLLDDADVLFRGLLIAHRSGTLFTPTSCSGVTFNPMTPVPAGGGLAGWRGTVDVTF